MSTCGSPYLVNKLMMMNILRDKDLYPKLLLSSFNQVMSLLLEHGVVVGNDDKLVVAEPFSIHNVGQVRVLRLTELSNYQRFIQLNYNQQRNRVSCRMLTLFSKECLGLLLLSIRILAIALKTVGSWLPDWT